MGLVLSAVQKRITENTEAKRTQRFRLPDSEEIEMIHGNAEADSLRE
jgi:hypothetical protein